MYYNHLILVNCGIPLPGGLSHYHGNDGIGISLIEPFFGNTQFEASIGPLKYDVNYTPDLPDFLEKELLPIGEFHRRKKEAKKRSKLAILKKIAEENQKVDEYNATHSNKKGHTAYLECSGAKMRSLPNHPYVIGNHDYAIYKDQAMPVYDSDCMRVGNGFAMEINQLQDVSVDNVFEIYEKDINEHGKLVKNKERGCLELKIMKNPPEKHINPVPTNPISKYLMSRRLVKEYNNLDPFLPHKYIKGIQRMTEKTGEFITVYNKKENENFYHFIVPRRLSHAVIEDEMHGDCEPQIEANIVPQLNFPASELVKYPMIDFEHPTFFRHYPKGLGGEKIREKEALDFKLGQLPCAVYNHMDRSGIIDEMHRSIDDKYEQIRIARSSKK